MPRIFVLMVVLWAVGMGTAPPAEGAGPDPAVDRLVAFARLYGYIRFFHPSDEAAAVDWERFAVLGTERIRNLPEGDPLAPALRELFLPLAPTLQIGRPGDPPVRPQWPEDRAGVRVVAWQHIGVGLGLASNVYTSARAGRVNRLPHPASSQPAHVHAEIDARPLQGREIRFTGLVRVDPGVPRSGGGLWLQVIRADGGTGFSDTMADRRVREDEWTVCEITGPVAANAERIRLGVTFAGCGRLWADGLVLSVRLDDGGWEDVPLPNAGFEEVDGAGPVPGWRTTMSFQSARLVEAPVREGERALLIDAPVRVVEGKLFDALPDPAEMVERELGAGLVARFPLALYADAERTYGRGNAESPGAAWQAELDELAGCAWTADREGVRLANVIIAWNVLQHFYPYFDAIPSKWDEVLTDCLARTLGDRTVADHRATLEQMAVALYDGHASVSHHRPHNLRFLPIRTYPVGEEIVVTGSRLDTVRRGDRVVSVDGREAMGIQREQEAKVSGSVNWKKHRARAMFGASPEPTAALTLERVGRRLDVVVERSAEFVFHQIEEFDHPVMAEIEAGIHYVDLSRAPMDEIEARIDSLASAKGVIFDLRAYPNNNHLILPHLLREPDRSYAWMQIPRLIRPDQDGVDGWNAFGWYLMPKAPRISGRVVFLTEGRAISYAESVLGFVEGYGLGEIVGQPTAGANGNVNTIPLLAGFEMTFTGMKVLKHDGSPHHLVGVRPTVWVERTRDDIAAGRDTFLERALEIVRSSPADPAPGAPGPEGRAPR